MTFFFVDIISIWLSFSLSAFRLFSVHTSSEIYRAGLEPLNFHFTGLYLMRRFIIHIRTWKRPFRFWNHLLDASRFCNKFQRRGCLNLHPKTKKNDIGMYIFFTKLKFYVLGRCWIRFIGPPYYTGISIIHDVFEGKKKGCGEASTNLITKEVA